jgi:hypothetical protein
MIIMDQIDTVWVVEQGSYSDYRVVGVFTEKRYAQVIADQVNKIGADEATVAEWPLNPCIEDLNAGRVQFNVRMQRDGTVEDVTPREFLKCENTTVAIWQRTRVLIYAGTGVPDCLTACVWATDQQHAVKIVNERRAQMIAQGAWPV